MIDNWKDRVLDEKVELFKKYLRLRDFIDSNADFHTIQTEDQELLKEQLKIMADYLNVLEKRINRF